MYDLETFTGIKFQDVIKHRGYETVHRLVMQHVGIFQGRQLFKEVADDCVFCKKIRIKYVKQLMGPLAESQLTISPIFYSHESS